MPLRLLIILLILGVSAVPIQGSQALVSTYHKIVEGQQGFVGPLSAEDRFGNAVATVDDYDGNGVREIAVAAYTDDGAVDAGAIFILFMNTDGTILSEARIANGNGGLPATTLDAGDLFGSSIAYLGDLDGNGVGDIAVGAQHDDDGGNGRGAIWILFMNSSANVDSTQKISDTEGSFSAVLDDNDSFGCAAVGIGDLNSDGNPDLLIGALGDDDGEIVTTTSPGAVYVLFLNSSGTVSSYQKISDTAGGLIGALGPFDNFGTSVASIGDLDGDGIVDIAVGAQGDASSGTNVGAVWVLFLTAGGTIDDEQRITNGQGNFGFVLDASDELGRSMAATGDVDGDGVPDVISGAINDDDGGGSQVDDFGAVYVLLLNTDGSVRDTHKISTTAGGFGGALALKNHFGVSAALLGDIDGDGGANVAIGAHHDSQTGTREGAVWILDLYDFIAPFEQHAWNETVHFDFWVTNPDTILSVDGLHFSGPRVIFSDGTPANLNTEIVSCQIEDTLAVILPASMPSHWTRIAGGDAWWFFPSVSAGQMMPSMSLAFTIPPIFQASGICPPSMRYEVDFFILSGADTVSCGNTRFSCDPLVPTAISGPDSLIRSEYREILGSNRPNPFNPSTTIRYTVADRGPVELRIIDVRGRLVNTLVREAQGAGEYTVRWNGKSAAGTRVASGVYFFQIIVGGKTESRKMVMLQ